MAKVSSIKRNEKRIALSKKYEAKRQRLHAIIHDRNLSLEERFAAQMKLDKLPKNACPVRVHNRCFLTGRSKSYYRKFGVSRIMLRQLASQGQLPGVVKASW